MIFKRTLLLVWIASGVSLTITLSAQAEDAAEKEDAAGIEFFENKIRPVLVSNCYNCHAEGKKVKGGLLLDSRDGIRDGGDSGHAIVPNDLEESLLISAIKYESFEMPPKGKLPDQVIADFEKWIEMGAPDPRTQKVAEVRSEIDIEKGKEFWAFQSPKAKPIPDVKDRSWPKNEIDHFILSKLEAKQLQPVADASKATWIRRVTFDLTGLPPTQDELNKFVADDSSTAYEKVVDRLLNSAHFGERWARHWFDIARYAESMGKTRNYPFTFAWKYRDYVIQSFNEDKPYDRFLLEQIAGDLLPYDGDEEKASNLIATGFLALGSHDLNERNALQFKMDVAGEQLDVVGRSLMAVTIGCARCHDHKFDPIPTEDYYAMAGIFSNTKLMNGYSNRRQGNNYTANATFHKLPVNGEQPQPELEEPEPQLPRRNNQAIKRVQNRIANLREQLDSIKTNGSIQRKQKQKRMGPVRQQLKQAQAQLKKLNKRQNNRRGGAKAPAGALAMGVSEADRIRNTRIHIRGDVKNLGQPVPRGFLKVVAFEGSPKIDKNESGRLQLAEWLVDANHPLTARVMVNRIWHQLFGRGIVRTTDNFGKMGARPSHPELLDHLAVQFMQDGWSIKQLIRHMVLSRTYQLATTSNEANDQVDAENVYLWRMNQRRLEAEAIRDAMLLVSGELVTEPPKGSPVSKMNIREVDRRRVAIDGLQNGLVRSVYSPILRSGVDRFFTIFDFPEPSDIRGTRDITTVATQALFMMNSPFVSQQARIAAQSTIQHTQDMQERVRIAYEKTLSRAPTASDIERTKNYVDKMKNEVNAWRDIYHALFASAEFRYR